MKSSLYPAQELRRRALAWAVRLRVNPRVIRIQDMRRKWGSCSTSGTVTLASDLVDRDTRFQDFVIAHELLHLRIPTHGRLFKALMSAHLPGWQKLERELASSHRTTTASAAKPVPAQALDVRSRRHGPMVGGNNLDHTH